VLRNHSRWSRFAVFALAISSAAASSCAAPPVIPDTSREIAVATGRESDIAFRWSGAPLDDDGILLSAGVLGREEAIGAALRCDPRIQSALARVRIALAESERARIWPNPILSIAFRLPEGGATPRVEAELAAELIALLRRPRRVRAADHRMSRASADAVATALDVVAETEETYAQAQASDAAIPSLERRLAIVTRLEELSRARLAAGEGSRPERTAIESRRIEVEIETEAAKRKQLETRLRLLRLVGRPSSGTEFALEPWRAPESAVLAESECVREALERRPEIRARRLALLALDEESGLAESSWLAGASFGIDAERDGDWSAGPAASLPFPVFDPGTPERARIAAERAEHWHEITLAERRIVEDVRGAHEALRYSVGSLARVRDELIPSQERRRRRDAEALFRAGESDVTPVLLAEQDLQRAATMRVELELEASIARSRLERAVGGSAALPESAGQP